MSIPKSIPKSLAEFVHEGRLIAKYFGTGRTVAAAVMASPAAPGSASSTTGAATMNFNSTLRLANTDYDEKWGSPALEKTAKLNSGLSTWASSMNINKSD